MGKHSNSNNANYRYKGQYRNQKGVNPSPKFAPQSEETK